MEQKTYAPNEFFTEMQHQLPWESMANSMLTRKDIGGNPEDEQQVQDMIQSIKFYYISKWYKTNIKQTLELIYAKKSIQRFMRYNPGADEAIDADDCTEFVKYARKNKLTKRWNKKIQGILKAEQMVIKYGKYTKNDVFHPNVWIKHKSLVGSIVRISIVALPFVCLAAITLHANIWHNDKIQRLVTIEDQILQEGEVGILAFEAELAAIESKMDAMEVELAELRTNDITQFNIKIKEFNAIANSYNDEIQQLDVLEDEYNKLVVTRNTNVAAIQSTHFIPEYIEHVKQKWLKKDMNVDLGTDVDIDIDAENPAI